MRGLLEAMRVLLEAVIVLLEAVRVRVTVNRSTSAGGPFIKQSFIAIDTGFG